MTTLIQCKKNPAVNRHELRLLIDADTTSEPIAINEIGFGVSISLTPTYAGASARIQVSISPLSLVKAGNALWFNWALGEVTQAALDFSKAPISAVRCITTSAPAIIEILY